MTDLKTDPSPAPRVILVTGPSGAGRSTAINVLEDMGYEAIDNLPLSLLPRLLDGPPGGRPLALGLDTRNRDFSTNALIETIDTLESRFGIDGDLLFLDCRDDELQHRFSATRRRHPLAPAESPDIGIAREKDLLAPIRNRADILIDTSELSPHQLRDELHRLLTPEPGTRMAVTINSFSYKRGLPRGVDMVFDGRFLRNPYWVPHLRDQDGRNAAIRDYVQGDPRFAAFFDHVRALALMLLPAYVDEGKTHFAIGFGCSGGRHRSVALAEMLGKALAEEGWQVSIRHRELDRQQG
ncbi:RNase adapter RapZ [Lutimaribacter sp. EGI FJ00015]|uniref:RNase adapter RapZ n=1 Tax=Lutimaribacter degradans TaxID=2945989 RepID=A0ACC5ZZ60_9RHOB|nr:RNase adapter RapZ [Lutimaribacter sp. EGI FJ00013]MCM2563470.1 RNase adapter RapZ [Lutimaribacter sp. EGI FJ00013]MCO0614650.1 RNase adapter RapZ [Lutimaribacter sp. EGI FJ00015]MCO0637321.1 RNase adapter RapZ [Lutimaribacter sp. EGI FJ00014]